MYVYSKLDVLCCSFVSDVASVRVGGVLNIHDVLSQTPVSSFRSQKPVRCTWSDAQIFVEG